MRRGSVPRCPYRRRAHPHRAHVGLHRKFPEIATECVERTAQPHAFAHFSRFRLSFLVAHKIAKQRFECQRECLEERMLMLKTISTARDNRDWIERAVIVACGVGIVIFEGEFVDVLARD